MGGQAAASVIATEDLAVAGALQRILRRGLLRIYTNHDVIGCELGGALKNVVALACGMAQGLSVGDNTRAAVMTRGLAELTRLGVAMGGEPATFAGLAGMGDLIVTCISPHSRNRHVGEQLGAGRPLEEILGEMSMVAEGVKTAVTVHELAARLDVEHARLRPDVQGGDRRDQRRHGVHRPPPPRRPRSRSRLIPADPALIGRLAGDVQRDHARSACGRLGETVSPAHLNHTGDVCHAAETRHWLRSGCRIGTHRQVDPQN